MGISSLIRNPCFKDMICKPFVVGWVSDPLTKKETNGSWSTMSSEASFFLFLHRHSWNLGQKSRQRCDILKGCAKTSSSCHTTIQYTTVIWKRLEDFPSIFHSKPDKKKTSKSKAALHPCRFPPCPSLVEFGLIQQLGNGYPIQMHLWMPAWPSLTAGKQQKLKDHRFGAATITDNTKVWKSDVLSAK